jgi:tRNA-splicing ligase RtcB (3'-phosphate/5'-hydroxy nucleic acid ligase)
MITEVSSQLAVRLDPWMVEVPRTARSDMRVPARIYADEELWRQIEADRTVDQLINVATLPGVVERVYAMPDAHEGYGFPVGGVAAFGVEDGVISPGGVGYDINCGVRLLVTELQAPAIADRLEPLVHELSRSIPSGTGRGHREGLSPAELEGVLTHGCRWMLEHDRALPADLETTEAGGCFPQAAACEVSERARQRGANQLGTIGAGNHFVEVQRVEEIHDAAAARVLGLEVDQVAVMVHTGSRGLGHQVCTEYVRRMDEAMARYGLSIPDRELACTPFRSPEGQAYFGAMCAAANFAFANRQQITQLIRRVFARELGDAGGLRLVYDVAHNMAKVERHGERDLVVHRKGATRAFGPSHAETPERYREIGQPVLIPGSMGTASFVLLGLDSGLARGFGSACHGAGRAMSRGAARRLQPGSTVRRELRERGIVVRCPSSGELAEEAPQAYKDVDRVVEVVERNGLARRVARLVPLGIVKG